MEQAAYIMGRCIILLAWLVRHSDCSEPVCLLNVTVCLTG